MSNMDRVLKAVFLIETFKTGTDDDFVDRLNRQYTPSILVVFTILLSVKQFVGEPINCWCPAQFTESHIEYAHSMCWVNKQYYVPFHEQMPAKGHPRESISYYRWVPVIILTQAWVFFFMGLFWRLLNQRVGFSLSTIIETAMECKNSLDLEMRTRMLRYMVVQVDHYLMSTRSHKKGWCIRLKKILTRHCCLICGKFDGNYLTCSYLIIKIMYIMNILVQFIMLDIILGFKGSYYLYGFQRIGTIFRGDDWDSPELFPRVTLCEFNIRQHNNLQMYTVQCALPVNLFNEKIFLFMWFLLFSLFITTCLNFVHWFMKIVFVPLQYEYVKRELRSMNLDPREMESVKKFTEHYLRRDGLLILRLVSKNAGDLITAELLHGLWANLGPGARRDIVDNHGKDNRPLMSQEIV